MTTQRPRLGEPTYTVPVGDVFADGDSGLGGGGALPNLLDLEPAAAIDPSDEALIRVEHERIRVLSNYWHAGWGAAIPSTWLRRSTFERLVGVAESLSPRWGIAVFDAWRPIELQRELFDAAREYPGLMAQPSADPSTPPPHLTGGAVDITLTFDGAPLALGSGFDDITDRAHTAYFEGLPGLDRDLRRALFHSMTAHDFVVYDLEWWHFEYGTRRWAAVHGTTPFFGPASPPS